MSHLTRRDLSETDDPNPSEGGIGGPIRSNAFYFPSIHAQGRARHPARRGRHHEGQQFRDLFRLAVTGNPGFLREFLHRLRDAHGVRG